MLTKYYKAYHQIINSENCTVTVSNEKLVQHVMEQYLTGLVTDNEETDLETERDEEEYKENEAILNFLDFKSSKEALTFFKNRPNIHPSRQTSSEPQHKMPPQVHPKTDLMTTKDWQNEPSKM
jgi:hypothetical protein